MPEGYRCFAEIEVPLQKSQLLFKSETFIKTSLSSCFFLAFVQLAYELDNKRCQDC